MQYLLAIIVLYTTTLLRGVNGLSISSSEASAVEQQLGYLPTNFVKVSAWTSTTTREPVAIQTHPLDGGSPRRKQSTATPFPTLYWLCHKQICTAVAELERTGYVKLLQKKLTETPNAGFHQSHLDYAKERWSTLTDKEQASLTPNMVDMLQHSGVAGTMLSDDEAIPNIKCLHAHYAHYRSSSGSNIVGQWVHELLTQEFPDLLL